MEREHAELRMRRILRSEHQNPSCPQVDAAGIHSRRAVSQAMGVCVRLQDSSVIENEKEIVRMDFLDKLDG